MLFNDAIGEFLADLELAGRAKLTRKRHRVELGLLGRWIESEGLQWQEMSRKQLQRYLRLRANLSASARANMLCSFRVFFTWAVDQEYIARSPAVNFRTPQRDAQLRQTEIYVSAEVDDLRSAVDQLPNVDSW